MNPTEIANLLISKEISLSNNQSASICCDFCSRGAEEDNPVHSFQTVEGTVERFSLHESCISRMLSMAKSYDPSVDVDTSLVINNAITLCTPLWITYERACELYETGDWLEKNQIDALVWKIADEALEKLRSEDESAAAAWVDYKPKENDFIRLPPGKLLPSRLPMLHALRDLALEGADYRQINPETMPGVHRDRFTPETYTRGGKVIKIGATFRQATLPALSIFGSILAVTNWENTRVLFGNLLRSLTNVRDVLRALKASVEYLHGEELFVAEYVFMINCLRGRPATLAEIEEKTTTDYPIFADQPLGWESMSVDERKQAVGRVLNSLSERGRGVLKHNDGTYTFEL